MTSAAQLPSTFANLRGPLDPAADRGGARADRPGAAARASDPGPVGESVLRDLARRGILAAEAAGAPPDEYARLAGTAYALAWPVVFNRVTRPVERRRGHWTCSIDVLRLADECLDGFHDDVEAVVSDLLVNAKTPIRNIEGWMSGRVTAVTIDGHRRRRGQRGALQRPRVPEWLAAELGRDAWLTQVALEILNWVGVPATAGAGVWPLESWARRRAAVTGDWTGSDPEAVAREVEVVLAAMRRRPKRYLDYVERPLGRKTAPVAPSAGDGAGVSRPLLSVAEHEVDEARLARLASAAVDALALGLSGGGDLTETVVRVIGTVFGSGTGGDELDRMPGSGPALDERVSALLADPRAVTRIVASVRAIVVDAR
ncbi:hypothetical protein [Plantactinospora sp. KLBMP9567]|uniref:hypothetical protein n=1 Tax=Plantactinospora sp. KLBMP9567 TaxID=3085900 RepID=UPI0029812456|nr:hypothetical protein [Plantactinospora sp. KLBMP9567]MDW5327527.1 hypothetical protein [Plantactinospora sp. KLBMP9567]